MSEYRHGLGHSGLGESPSELPGLAFELGLLRLAHARAANPELLVHFLATGGILLLA